MATTKELIASLTDFLESQKKVAQTSAELLNWRKWREKLSVSDQKHVDANEEQHVKECIDKLIHIEGEIEYVGSFPDQKEVEELSRYGDVFFNKYLRDDITVNLEAKNNYQKLIAALKSNEERKEFKR